jgi:hypothetical protein
MAVAESAGVVFPPGNEIGNALDPEVDLDVWASFVRLDEEYPRCYRQIKRALTLPFASSHSIFSSSIVISLNDLVILIIHSAIQGGYFSLHGGQLLIHGFDLKLMWDCAVFVRVSPMFFLNLSKYGKIHSPIIRASAEDSVPRVRLVLTFLTINM